MEWTTRKYEEEDDLERMNGWLAEHKQPEIDPYDVPEIGFMVCYRNRPIAAGFLRRIEGDNALFDSLVSNPNATSELRHKAMTLITDAIIKAAKDHSIKQVLAYSIDASVLKRAFALGFVKLPHTVIALDLKNGPSH